jgi:diaminohydroxyphosphoribosylaminopyrimidine deaminase/5-amino-6-(5-phosphoribosylamino)uracil reductase
MVGAGTVRADDPSLTVRDVGISHQTVRVVLSRGGKLSTSSQLARTAQDLPVWLCHGADAKTTFLEVQGVVSLPCAIASGTVDPADALRALAEKGITRVFCEGGGMLAASLLNAGLVDRLVVFSAGSAIGAEGTPMLAAMGVSKLADAPRFTLCDVQRFGADICHTWQRLPAP